MPEQPAELQRINWSSCFAFTQLFRSFKMAIHPSKLGLALAAILLVGAWGWALDKVWPSRYQPMPEEADAFWQRPNIDQWRDDMEDPKLGVPTIVTAAYQRNGLQIPPGIEKELRTNPRAGVRSALKDLKDGYYKEKNAAQTAPAYSKAYREAERARGAGIFWSFLRFETDAIRQFIDACATGAFTEGTSAVLRGRHDAGFKGGVTVPGRDPADPLANIYRPEDTGAGAVPSLFLMVRGLQWLVLEHPWFALLFLLGKLFIWSFFGGAICRMAALNFARDERIPVRSAIDFAVRKYIGFLTAPLLPIALILGIGVLMIIGGWIGSIPGIGAILAGLGMGLALLGGFVIALVIIGGLGGGSLMWPTIAVEGSDSFDAMSRSYSYVYSRPWKAAWYALVASVYGAICYLFARLFVYLMLRLTRAFVGVGMAMWTSRPGVGTPGASRIDVIWPTPTFGRLIHSPPPFGAQYDDRIGWFLTMIWVGLSVLLLCAFLVSFYFSASTIIYCLLRREVDATDLEDVYSEEADEEPLPAGTVPVPVADTGASPAEPPDAGTPPTTT